MNKNNTIEKICTEICVKYPQEWKFISQMLEKESIEGIVATYAKGQENGSIIDEFGLQEEEYDIASACLSLLFKKATVKMWMRISKEQANDLIRAMYAVKAVGVKLPNGVEYTMEDIKESWINANGNSGSN